MSRRYSEEDISKLFEKATKREMNKPKLLSSNPKPLSDKERILNSLDALMRSEGYTSPLEKRIAIIEKQIERIDFLESEFIKLKAEISEKSEEIKEKTVAEITYDENRKELESKYFGQIIALEPNSGKIVGIGCNIIEAYSDARKKSVLTSFVFRKVGYQSVYSLR